MTASGLELDRVVQALDALYSLDAWETDPAFTEWVPRIYGGIGYDHRASFEPGYCRRYNGLMLRSSEYVRQVYCAAFPTPDVLTALLAATQGDALLYLHHPLDCETSGAGFLPIPPVDLDRLRARGVSVYACHAPMDCHDTVGTNAAIVEALGVTVERPMAPYGAGYAGRVGRIPDTSLAELVSRVRGVFGVDRVEVTGGTPSVVSRVAVVAGGGNDPDDLREAEGLGAQAYITGEWEARHTPHDDAGRRWAEENRAACRAFARRSSMALIAVSHAASEYLVMRTQLAPWLEGLGLAAMCLPQKDWWR